MESRVLEVHVREAGFEVESLVVEVLLELAAKAWKEYEDERVEDVYWVSKQVCLASLGLLHLP